MVSASTLSPPATNLPSRAELRPAAPMVAKSVASGARGHRGEGRLTHTPPRPGSFSARPAPVRGGLPGRPEAPDPRFVPGPGSTWNGTKAKSWGRLPGAASSPPRSLTLLSGDHRSRRPSFFGPPGGRTPALFERANELRWAGPRLRELPIVPNLTGPVTTVERELAFHIGELLGVRGDGIAGAWATDSSRSPQPLALLHASSPSFDRSESASRELQRFLRKLPGSLLDSARRPYEKASAKRAIQNQKEDVPRPSAFSRILGLFRESLELLRRLFRVKWQD